MPLEPRIRNAGGPHRFRQCFSPVFPFPNVLLTCRLSQLCSALLGRDVLSGHTEKGGNHRQFCIPKFAHIGLSRAPEVHQRNCWMLHIFSLRTGREQHVPDSSSHSLCLIKLFNSTTEMVRFIFRPFLQENRTICTSVSLVHQIFLRHSSPSFGS